MFTDTAACLGAVQGRDPRFDGIFVTAVRTTKIYCRPSCPAMTPSARNMTFYPTSAAAQSAGYRACKRCRPDASPGSPQWNERADMVARAMRMIGDGVIDREGVQGLARRLGYSARQLERQLSAELGAGPLALARAQRAQTARVLLETSAMSVTDVAHAAGFGSIRSFNDTMREVFAMTPSELRARSKFTDPAQPDAGADAWHCVQLRLAFRQPICPDNLFGHLAATGVPGVEEWRDGAYRRSMRLPAGPGIVSLRPHPDHIAATLWLSDVRDLPVAVSRCRWLLDLDADPVAVDAALSVDPQMAQIVSATPGRRVPRTVDGAEMAVRIVLGQQISTRAARTHAARLVNAFGEEIADPAGGLTHLFPLPEQLAQASDATLAMPATRRNTVRALCAAIAAGEVDVSPGADWSTARTQLALLRGVGPWTIEGIAMRALGDPDAFVGTDLGVRAAMVALGVRDDATAIESRASRWRPWRSYAVQYLWGTSEHEINYLPNSLPN